MLYEVITLDRCLVFYTFAQFYLEQILIVEKAQGNRNQASNRFYICIEVGAQRHVISDRTIFIAGNERSSRSSRIFNLQWRK